MPTTITGDPSGVSNTLSRTVTAASNATPIVVTTSVPHLFGDGDTVVVSGVTGNTAANGTFRITKISSTTFSLDGSVGSGAYVSGGTAVDASLTPQFQIPSDGDPMDVASVNAAFEALADRTQFLALASRVQSVTFTADGTWTAPDDCQRVGFVEGCGGGGGGGGGRGGGATASAYPTGGGGGGGAGLGRRLVALEAGKTYTIDVGAGGAGGAATLAGSDGASTKLLDGATVLASFNGGGGGAGSTFLASGGTPYGVAAGGAPVALGVTTLSGTFAADVGPLPVSAGAGGNGMSKNTANTACRIGAGREDSTLAGAGGAAGADGADGAASHFGGGGGGGGGAGAYSTTTAPGGNGGDGSNAGIGVAGSAGTAGAASTGAGGGGGGAGGAGTTGSAAGGAGGNGGSGRVTIYYFGSPS